MEQDVPASVFSFGFGGHGQLGMENDENEVIVQQKVPIPLFHTKEVVKVACGGAFSLALTQDHAVYAWGDAYGNFPNEITALRSFDVCGISAGATQALAWTTSGKLISWTKRCHKTTASDAKPKIVPMPDTNCFVTFVSCGGVHTLILSKDGSLYAFGINSDGQLGVPMSRKDETNPIKLTTFDTWKRDPFGKRRNGTTFTAVAAGGLHSVAISSEGTLFTWGSNRFGQLGFDTREVLCLPVASALDFKPFNDRVGSITAGDYHTLVVTTDDKLYSFGRGKYGETGLGDTHDRYLPELVQFPYDEERALLVAASGGLHCAHSIVCTNKGLYGFGSNLHGQLGIIEESDVISKPSVINGIPHCRVLSIACGYMHTLVCISPSPSNFISDTNFDHDPEFGLGAFSCCCNELLLYIFGYLSGRDIIILGTASKYFSEIMRYENMWEAITRRDFKIPSSIEDDISNFLIKQKRLTWLQIYVLRARRGFWGNLEKDPVNNSNSIQKQSSRWFRNLLFFRQIKHIRVLTLGTEHVGKTLFLLKMHYWITNKPYYERKKGCFNTVPTAGFNVETIPLESNVHATVWDIGGNKRLWPLYRHYYTNTDLLVCMCSAVMDEFYKKECQEFWDQTFKTFYTYGIGQQYPPLLILINMLDLVGNKTHNKIREEICTMLNLDTYKGSIDIRFISVLEMSGNDLVDMLSDAIQCLGV